MYNAFHLGQCRYVHRGYLKMAAAYFQYAIKLCVFKFKKWFYKILIICKLKSGDYFKGKVITILDRFLLPVTLINKDQI